MVSKKQTAKNEIIGEECGADLPVIFNYLDYRDFLRDLCAARKKINPHFSYRYVSEKVGIRSGGFFSWVLQGKRNISDRLVLDLARFFKLGKAQSAYFEQLVEFNQAATHEERRHAFDKLVTMRRGNVRQVGGDQSEFYLQWYYPAFRELLAIMPISDESLDGAASALSPRIKVSEARQAVSLLERLGMAKKNEQGFYERTDAVISSKERVPPVALHDYQIGCIELAAAALDRFAAGERELSTVTMSIDEDSYGKILERMALLRSEVMEIARSTRRASRVMQLNMQFFPLSRKNGGQS